MSGGCERCGRRQAAGRNPGQKAAGRVGGRKAGEAVALGANGHIPVPPAAGCRYGVEGPEVFVELMQVGHRPALPPCSSSGGHSICSRAVHCRNRGSSAAQFPWLAGLCRPLHAGPARAANSVVPFTCLGGPRVAAGDGAAPAAPQGRAGGLAGRDRPPLGCSGHQQAGEGGFSVGPLLRPFVVAGAHRSAVVVAMSKQARVKGALSWRLPG